MKGDCCTGMTTTPRGPFAPDYFFIVVITTHLLYSLDAKLAVGHPRGTGGIFNNILDIDLSLRYALMAVQFQVLLSWVAW